jgi:hypothetical protein
MHYEDIKSESDYWEYCTIYSHLIPVHEQVDGKRGSYSLEDLEPELRAKHIKRMMIDGHIPVRLKTEEEMVICLENIEPTNGDLSGGSP